MPTPPEIQPWTSVGNHEQRIDEWGVVPDIMVMGKGMSGAIYPISATSYRPQLQSFFDSDPFIHISTYGGADLGCVACLAMLDQITEPGFLEHVQEMGERFADGFDRRGGSTG